MTLATIFASRSRKQLAVLFGMSVGEYMSTGAAFFKIESGKVWAWVPFGLGVPLWRAAGPRGVPLVLPQLRRVVEERRQAGKQH